MHAPSKLTRAINSSRPVKSRMPAKESARPSGDPGCWAANRQRSTGGATSSTQGHAIVRLGERRCGHGG